MTNYQEKYLQIAKESILESIDLDQYAVFLFGSRSRTFFSPNADIDIGILGDSFFPENSIYLIKEKIAESIVPYHLDIIDFYSVEENFKKIALQNFVIWNLPKHLKEKLPL